MTHTPFVDIYGRTWNNKPDHNTALMLKINPELMRAMNMFSYCLKNPNIKCYYHDKYPDTVDCYLLASFKKEEPWYVGIRYSDKDSDYLSPYIENAIIDIVIRHHLRNSGQLEMRAYGYINSQIFERMKEV